MPYIPPKYPGEIPTLEDLPDKTAYKDLVNADFHNAIKKELRAALIELGVNPSGDFDTVAERLAAGLVIEGAEDGDIIIRSDGEWARLPKGTDGYVLTMVDGLPAWQPGEGGDGIPTGLIAVWHGTLADIPDGWALCDGTNGTPNLLDKFVKSIPNASTNPGSAGGNEKHKHTGGAHTHSNNFSIPGHSEESFPGGEAEWYSAAHYPATHPISGGVLSGGAVDTSEVDARPPYYEVAYIMKT